MDYENKQCLLSSTTPHFHDHHYSSHEVLQISSGNEQSYRPERLSGVGKIDDDDDEPSVDFGARGKSSSHSAQTAIKLQRRAQRRDEKRKTAETADRRFAKLWRGLRQEELESPRYLQYREKQRQKARDRPDEVKIWPDDLEYAFQLALRVVPPRGRKKETVEYPLGYKELAEKVDKNWAEHDAKSKLCGRNELVSSHIQVLREFMKNKPGWLKHVNADMRPTVEGQAALKNQVHLQNLKLDNLRDDDFRLLVQDPLGPRLHSSALMCPPANAILGSNAPGQGPVVNRIEFEMFILSPAKEQTHRYTSHQTEIGAAPQALEEISDWRMSFPLLEDYHERSQLDSDIILIKSDIDLLNDYPEPKSTLSIRFRVNISGATGNDQWFTKTNYYENNGQPVDMDKFCEKNNLSKTSSWDTPTVLRTPGNASIQLEIPLQSKWWVQLFTNMAARKYGRSHDPYLLQQEEDWSRRYLQEMSIMQELRVRSEVAGASTKQVAIILWKFSQSPPGEAATTTWRKLKPPPQRFQVNSPAQSPKPPLQYTMDLDSSLHTIAMPQPIFAYAGRFLHQSELLAKDSERIVTESQSIGVSPSPALTPDYTTSFPSSTTTSFPPSVTQGYLSHEDSLESGCYSQDNHSYRQGSFASQNSFNYSQKSFTAYQEPRTYDEDLNHLPGSLRLGSQDAAYYAQQSLDAIADFHPDEQYDDEVCQDGFHHADLHAMHDLSRGQVQLSFQTQDLSPNPHPPPYLATPINFSHHEGLIQADAHPNDHGFHQADHEDLAQADDDINEHELHEASHKFSALPNEPEIIAADLPLDADLDFSAWETHFTPEELDALRSHHDESNVQSDLRHPYKKTRGFDGHRGHVHTASDWTFVQTRKHLHDTSVEQPGNPAIHDQVADEEEEDGQNNHHHDRADDDFDFEEIYGPESQLAQSQAVEGQELSLDSGLVPDYDDDDVHEDHLL
ncbi:MAG: hypothetical protein Q9182_000280 [Xanthomendoza sp. 2 TL-2023]